MLRANAIHTAARQKERDPPGEGLRDIFLLDFRHAEALAGAFVISAKAKRQPATDLGEPPAHVGAEFRRLEPEYLAALP